MKDIFVTSTFRNDWNKSFNLKLAQELEARGFSIFLPQRDAEQVGDRRKTFLEDVAGMDNCKMILAVGTKTQTANWGFEIGYLYKSGKPVIVITDKEHPVELMPEGACAKIFVLDNLDAINSYVEDLVSSIKRCPGM